MIQNLSSVTVHVDEPLDELDRIVGIIRTWSERADQVDEEVGSVVTVPGSRMAHLIKVFRHTWRLIMDAIFGDSQPTDHKDKAGGEIKR